MNFTQTLEHWDSQANKLKQTNQFGRVENLLIWHYMLNRFRRKCTKLVLIDYTLLNLEPYMMHCASRILF